MLKSYSKAMLIALATVMLFLSGLTLTLSLNLGVVQATPGSGTLFAGPGGRGDACSQAQPCSAETALSQAVPGDNIYLAQGVYTSASDAVFNIDQSLQVYGGWNGAPTGPLVLDPVAYPTIVDAEEARRGVLITGPAEVLLNGFTVRNGVHSVAGAGLYALDSSLDLRELIFSANVVSATVVGSPFGGGAAIEGGQVAIIRSTFERNAVKGKKHAAGGGLTISNTVEARVDENLFKGNDAWNGSGMYFNGASGARPDLVVAGNTFDRNGRGLSGKTGGGYAGALQVDNASARILDNVFSGNRAGNEQGAVRISSSWLDFERNTLIGNQARRASAMAIWSSSPFTLTNNVIAHNDVTGLGDPALEINWSSGQALHNTLAANAGGEGVRLRGMSDVQLINNIIVSHTVGISVTGASSASWEGSFWGKDEWANDIDWGGDGSIVSTGVINIREIPVFVSPDSDDFHLRASSPAVDAGIVIPVDDDIDHDPRPTGAGYDIGADEVTMFRETYLPLLVR